MLDSPPLPFAGVDNDETIKVSRSGGADPDGNQPGDLYIVIKVTIYIYIYICLVCHHLFIFSGYFTAWMPSPQPLNCKISFASLQVREDPVFRREGADIHVDAVLSITQVMLSNVFIL